MNKWLAFALAASLTMFVATRCDAADEWNKAEIAKEVAFQTLTVLDWGQTADISRRCVDGSIRETNPILGSCPSRGRVNAYFPVAMLAHWGISHMLPRKYRQHWQDVTLVVEAFYVHTNYRIGININF